MKLRFLKVRMQIDTYERLKIRAAESGKPISTFANTLLEQDDCITNTAVQLVEINSQLQELAALLVTSRKPKYEEGEIKTTFNEILLIVRELALERNAQILSRVAAQIKSQSIGVRHE